MIANKLLGYAEQGTTTERLQNMCKKHQTKEKDVFLEIEVQGRFKYVKLCLMGVYFLNTT